MTEVTVIRIIQEALWISFLISAPILIGSLIIGLLIGIFQAVTQIHEMTLTFVPKIIVVVFISLVIFPWIVNKIIDYTIRLFNMIPHL